MGVTKAEVRREIVRVTGGLRRVVGSVKRARELESRYCAPWVQAVWQKMSSDSIYSLGVVECDNGSDAEAEVMSNRNRGAIDKPSHLRHPRHSTRFYDAFTS